MMAADIALQFMIENHLPMNRQTYLEVAFFGQPPNEIDAEIEADIPIQFRLGEPGDWEEFE
jgi:hypothetical protein